MQLTFDKNNIEKYTSKTQIARVLTENWVYKNMYCPHCGNLHIEQFKNNKPVADFFCPSCNNEYELKSKNGAFKNKINDGAYSTMINRITGNNNPDFFFMNYSKSEMKVKDFIFIPKHFFVPDIIEKRKPLSSSAQRKGWIGCNILINKIPEQGKIYIILDSKIVDKNNVINKVQTSDKLEITDIQNREWLFDVLNCVNSIKKQLFTLDDIYKFENALKILHPQMFTLCWVKIMDKK